MTPHIEAKIEDIAKTVIMPGDPLRAEFIAKTYLKDYRLVNQVRGIYAYTGYYNDKLVTVMASGMGNPSIGIYSYELFKYYNVDNIIRIGSAGAYLKDIKLYDLILVTNSYSKSSYAFNQNGATYDNIDSSKLLNEKIIATASNLNINLRKGRIHTSDVFYTDINNINDLVENYNCLGVEMESFALFHNAKVLNKNATTILTVSDNVITKEETSSMERQNSFTEMIKIVLESL